MRIWGHVMLSRFFGPALRRALAPIEVFAFAVFLLVMILCAATSSSVAHNDDDQGDEASATLKNSWPRVTAQSELYEVVGILKGDRLSIYLDDYATNESVIDATFTVKVGDDEPVI